MGEPRKRKVSHDDNDDDSEFAERLKQRARDYRATFSGSNSLNGIDDIVDSELRKDNVLVVSNVDHAEAANEALSDVDSDFDPLAYDGLEHAFRRKTGRMEFESDIDPLAPLPNDYAAPNIDDHGENLQFACSKNNTEKPSHTSFVEQLTGNAKHQYDTRKKHLQNNIKSIDRDLAPINCAGSEVQHGRYTSDDWYKAEKAQKATKKLCDKFDFVLSMFKQSYESGGFNCGDPIELATQLNNFIAEYKDYNGRPSTFWIVGLLRKRLPECDPDDVEFNEAVAQWCHPENRQALCQAIMAHTDEGSEDGDESDEVEDEDDDESEDRSEIENAGEDQEFEVDGSGGATKVDLGSKFARYMALDRQKRPWLYTNEHQVSR